VKNGGNAIFLLDRIAIEKNSFTINLPENFENLLSEWGLAVEQKLIADAQHEKVAFSNGLQPAISTKYPFPQRSAHCPGV
jgi:hypothetical protein